MEGKSSLVEQALISSKSAEDDTQAVVQNRGSGRQHFSQNLSQQLSIRAELKGKLNGANRFLQKSAIFCCFLRKSAASCKNKKKLRIWLRFVPFSLSLFIPLDKYQSKLQGRGQTMISNTFCRSSSMIFAFFCRENLGGFCEIVWTHKLKSREILWRSFRRKIRSPIETFRAKIRSADVPP